MNSMHWRSPCTLTPSHLLPSSLSCPPLSPTSSHPPTFPQGGMGGSLKCLINERDLFLSEHLGAGCFGLVRKGEWRISNDNRVKVAVKTLRGDTNSDPKLHLEFLQEVNAMYTLDHPHLIRLYGIVATQPMKMVTELAPLGSLLSHLHSFNGVYSLQLLWSYSIQIASGMSYLETHKIIHRDLATRNVLVMSESIVKIGDFGLTRQLEANNDYYTTSPNRKIPYAWCAPESLKFRKFSHLSDVWMFGVTMWEMFTYGQEPWLDMNGTQILESIEKQFARLEWPEHCPPMLYSIMLKCWAFIPKERPNFTSLISLLQEAKPVEVKVLKVLHHPISMPLNAGDVISVIEAGVDAELWMGQNQRTLKIGPFPAAAVSVEDSKRVSNSGHTLSDSLEALSLMNEDSHKQTRSREKEDQARPHHVQAKCDRSLLRRIKSKSMEVFPAWMMRGELPPETTQMDSIAVSSRKMSTPNEVPTQQLVENSHNSASSKGKSTMDWLLAVPTLHGRTLSLRRKDKVSCFPNSDQGPTEAVPQLSRFSRSTSARAKSELQRKIKEVAKHIPSTTPENCQEALRFFGGDVTRAVQYLKVIHLHNVARCSKDECRRILEKVHWSLEAASLHILYSGINRDGAD